MIRIPWRIPIVAGLVVTLIAGSYFTGRSAGTTACTAERQQHELALADLWRAEVARRQAVADDLQRQLAAADTKTRTIYKEVIREIPAATLGRPCLSDDALGLLDRFQLAAQSRGGLPATTGESAGASGTAATDTQVAQWAADVIEQHERERARCNALIDWHLAD